MYILGNEEAVVLHSHSLEKIRGRRSKNRKITENKNQIVNNLTACYITSALKTQEKLLSKGWPI